MNKLNFNHINIKEIILFMLCISTLVGWSLWRIDEQCAPIILMDEFGYWSNAAFFVGNDWSEIAKFNSYYSYGYSLILVPIILLFSGTTLSYQIAIIVNGVFLCITFLLLIYIGKSLFRDENRLWIIISAYIAIIYPSYGANVHIAWAETLLVLMYVMCVYILVLLLKTPRLLYTVFFALSLFFSYIVHQRCLGLLGAGVLIFILMYKNKDINIKHIISFIATLVLCLIIHSIIKDNILEKVLVSVQNEKASLNDYSSIGSFIINWFNLEGLGKLLISYVGKIFYLTISTYGLFPVGIVIMLRECFGKKTEKNGKISQKKMVFFFLLLSFFAILSVASVFTLDPLRLDVPVYGRYTEWALAPILLITLILINKHKNNSVIYIANIIITLMMALILNTVYENHSEWNLFFVICSLVMAMYYRFTGDNGYQFIYLSTIVSSMVMFIVSLIGRFKGKSQRIVIVMIFLPLFLYNTYWCTNRAMDSNYRAGITKEISECINQRKDEDVYFVMDDGQTIWYVADVQVLNINRNIKEIPLDKIDDLEGFIMISSKSDYIRNIEDPDKIQVRDGIITLLYLEN